MSRSLTHKEHQIFTSFQQKLVLKEVSANGFSVIKDNRHFTCATPVIYKIENTDAYLVFGNLQGGYDIKKLQQELAKYQNIENVQQSKELACKDNTCEDATCHDNACHDTTCEDTTCKDTACQDTTCEDVTEVDDTKIVKEDVEALIEQTGCTKKEAMQVLAQCNYDCVEAIIKLEEKNNK